MPAHLDRRRRWVVVAAAIMLLATGWAGYRTFAPAEIVDPAGGGYPAPVAAARPGVYGALIGAPLVVDGRLRVYAAMAEVHADGPVDAGSSVSPYWAYRRWPARLVGLAAAGSMVFSQWSDRQLVALDARTGRPAWRAVLPSTAAGYSGRRTGAATSYAPADLLTVVLPDGRQVLVVHAGGHLRGYAGVNGRLLWQRPADRCAAVLTGPGVVALADGCGPQATLRGYAPLTGATLGWEVPLGGPPTGVGCPVGRSGCGGWRAGGKAFTFDQGGGPPVAAPALADPQTMLAGGIVVGLTPGSVLYAVRPDGTRIWSAPQVPGTRWLAAESGAVHLLRPDRTVLTLAPGDGRLLSAVSLPGAQFQPGYVYLSDRYLFLERLRPGARPADDDNRYFFPTPAVLVVGT